MEVGGQNSGTPVLVVPDGSTWMSFTAVFKVNWFGGSGNNQYIVQVMRESDFGSRFNWGIDYTNGEVTILIRGTDLNLYGYAFSSSTVEVDTWYQAIVNIPLLGGDAELLFSEVGSCSGGSKETVTTVQMGDATSTTEPFNIGSIGGDNHKLNGYLDDLKVFDEKTDLDSPAARLTGFTRTDAVYPTNPTPGTHQITLTGTNFLENFAVTYGGDDNTLYNPTDNCVRIDSSTIVCDVEEGVGIGHVWQLVADVCGATIDTSGLSPTGISFEAPTISGVSAPSDLSLGGGERITLTGTNFVLFQMVYTIPKTVSKNTLKHV